MPEPGEAGEIWVADLESGEAEKVGESRGWEPQLGPNLQWGGDDDTLLFTDVDTESWLPHGARIDWRSGERASFGRGVYHADANTGRVLTACPARMQRTQFGYGAPVPKEAIPRNVGPSETDGIYLSDSRSGETRLLVSIAEALEAAYGTAGMDYFRDREIYAFHAKWNPQGDRLLFSLRHFPASHGNRFNVILDGVLGYEVFTMRPDGTELRLAVPDTEWRKGGHHINWFPDGRKLSMNLNLRGEGMRFVCCNCDGSGLREIVPQVLGSGHPTVLPGERFILTDAYTNEPFAGADGTVPLRLVDCEAGGERELVRIATKVAAQDRLSALRVDPHPAWERGYRRLAFNGLREGSRAVFVAEFGE